MTNPARKSIFSRPKSKFIGVYWHFPSLSWGFCITRKETQTRVFKTGYKTEIEAAKAYDLLAIVFGRKTNFLKPLIK